MIKLGVFDLDRTLLDAEGKLPQDFYKNVAMLHERGVTVAIASGRPANFLLRLFDEAPDELLLSGEDGNIFYQGKKLIKARFMPWELIREVQAVIKDMDNVAAMYSNLVGNSYVEEKDLERLHAWGMGRWQPKEPYTLRGTEEICRIHCVCPGGEEMARRLVNGPLAVLRDRCDVLGEGFGWIGIMEKGLNKSVAVKYFMEYLGIGPDEVAVFGDNDNDVPMFSMAKYSYAMKNAAPEIKRKAAFETRYDHTENGAMRQLIELTERLN